MDDSPTLPAHGSSGDGTALSRGAAAAAAAPRQANAFAPESQRSTEATAHLDRGSDCYSRGDYEGALVAFSAAVRLDAADSEAYARRGLTHLGRGDYAGAGADFTESLHLDFNLAFQSMQRVLAQATQRRKGDYPRAGADADRALGLNPDLVAARLLRGNAFFQQGRYDPAMADFNLVLTSRDCWT